MALLKFLIMRVVIKWYVKTIRSESLETRVDTIEIENGTYRDTKTGLFTAVFH